MSFIKSIAAPLAAVGAICGVLALTAPANAEKPVEPLSPAKCVR